MNLQDAQGKQDRPVLILSGGTITSSLWRPLSEKYDLFFLYDQAAALAKEMKITNARALAEVIDSDLREMAANDAALLTGQVVNALPNIETRFNEIYHHQQPASLNSDLRQWWAGYCQFHIGERVKLIAALKKVIFTREVVGCLTHEDVAPDTRSMVDFCNAHGVPTIHLPHANCHLLDSAGPDIHRETRTDMIIAHGEYMANWYRRQGFEGAIEIAGNPAFDGLYDGNTPKRIEAREVLGIKPNELAICYAATWGQTTSLRGDPHEMDDGLAAVLKAAKELKALVLVKVHPHEPREADKFYAQALEVANVPGLVTRMHTPYIISAADVLVAQGPSNLCIEAAIVGTPACYIQTEGFDFEHNAILRSGPDGIETVIRKTIELIEPGYWEDFCTFYNATHPTGNAGERVVEIVERTCTSPLTPLLQGEGNGAMNGG